MAWEKFENIRGPKGDKGDKGSISSVSASTLPAGAPASAVMAGDVDVHLHLGLPKGDKGDRGPAGVVSSASAESVSADQPAAAIMSGTDDVKHLHLKIPRGLPGVDGVPAAEAVGTYLAASDSPTRPGFDAGTADLIGDPESLTGEMVRGLVAARVPTDTEVTGILADPESDAAGLLTYRSLRGNGLASERLLPVIDRPARPEGTLWPQSLEYVDETDQYLIGYNGTAGGQSVLRVDVVGRDGTLVESKQIVVDAGSSEGIPHWVNGLGHLMLFIRTDGEEKYSIWNYTQNTVAGPYSISGRYKASARNGILYTCDASTATGGVGKFYLYDFESVKAGTPVQIDTVDLERRNMFNKMQAFAVGNEGEYIGNFGKSTGDSQLFIYDSAGRKTYGVEYDRVDLAQVINGVFPGTITNPGNYRHEAEGVTMRGGTVVTSHIVDNNSPATARIILIEHFAGTPVRTAPVVNEHISEPIEIPLTHAGIEWFNAGNPGTVQRVGDDIIAWGELVMTDPDGLSGGANFATLPYGYRPDASIARTAVIGAGPGNTSTTEFRFYSTGVIRMSRYSSALVTGGYFYFYAKLPALR